MILGPRNRGDGSFTTSRRQLLESSATLAVGAAASPSQAQPSPNPINSGVHGRANLPGSGLSDLCLRTSSSPCRI